jgi:endonuclease III
VKVSFKEVNHDTVEERLQVLQELEFVHEMLLKRCIFAPRDKWEDWIASFRDDEGSDPAFMCLIVILMSSSTSDFQLGEIIPRLFGAGLTSANGVYDVVVQYGPDSLCSLMSESGRYYQNAERIINASSYFMERHGGRIPQSISIHELCTLLGVGYKTANIVITTSFGRVEGIPSDIHVIRWSKVLGWSSGLSRDGLHCSKEMEGWLPKEKWVTINPLFGAFGQLLYSKIHREGVMDVVEHCCTRRIQILFNIACKEY